MFQTMGGDFSSKGQQDCAKGIYCLAGKYTVITSCFTNEFGSIVLKTLMILCTCL